MPKSGNVRVVNIEMGLPDRTQARSQVEAALVQAKKDGVPILKFNFQRFIALVACSLPSIINCARCSSLSLHLAGLAGLRPTEPFLS
jgi:molybdopterin/thiamine biosynthesis adenylyltransferase